MKPVGPLRLAAIHLRVAALNEFQYRLNFFVQFLQSIVALAVGLIAGNTIQASWRASS